MINHIINKNKHFGRYPSCDHINNAIRYILENNTKRAIEELCWAIEKADGYYSNYFVNKVADGSVEMDTPPKFIKKYLNKKENNNG